MGVKKIDQGQHGDIVEGIRNLLRDEDAYARFWEQLHAVRMPVPDRPEVGFETKIVVGVVLGERPTGGYAVGIVEVLITESGGQIQVRFIEAVPEDACGTIQVPTSPYVLIVIEARNEEIEFSGLEEMRSC